MNRENRQPSNNDSMSDVSFSHFACIVYLFETTTVNNIKCGGLTRVHHHLNNRKFVPLGNGFIHLQAIQ